MPRLKPSAQTQQKIIEHLQAGKTLTLCVSICSRFGNLYGTDLNCTLSDIVNLMERGILTARSYRYAGIEYRELLLAEVPNAH